MNVPLVVGNWKMHGNQAECRELARAVIRGVKKRACRATVVLAPPFTALTTVAGAIRGHPVELAAQNCHWQESGAFTGEISPAMLKEVGCKFVLLGHSERRHVFQEGDQAIARKVGAALACGLRAILCIGETLEERRRGSTSRVIARQLQSALKGLTKDAIERIEIAYEPVWAIGTGHNATASQVLQVHRRIRNILGAFAGAAKSKRVRILYGGSVKSENIAELAALDEVDGVLVGGASLQAETFLPIVGAFN
jgi:triosephosphate isomerase (TIM)